MNHQERKGPIIPRIEPAKFIQRSNGTIKGYAVNTFHGLVKTYNEDRVSIIMNITKPNFKGRWPRCSYFGVFDGHGGNKCSDFLKQNMHKYITENSHFPHQPIEALKFGFKKAQQQFLSFAESQNPVERSGSCAIVILIIDEVCYIANVGDSRAILSANGGKNVYAISKDHKPDSETERQRIYNGGGRIYQSSMKNKNGNLVVGPYRIQPGKLSVSRSFGDIEAKLPKYDGNPKVLIAKPEITYFQINNQEHDYVMVCSDGIYDKLSNQEASHCFWDTKDKGGQQKDKYQFIGRVPSRVIQRSMEKLSMDNLTSLVILFEDHGKLMLPPKKISKIQKQSARRPISYDYDSQNHRKVANFKSNQDRSKEEQIGMIKHQRNQEVTPSSSRTREIHKQNKDNNRDHSQQHKRNQLQHPERLVKRKSTTNILANVQDRKLQHFNHGSHSLSNSVSAKMLAAGNKIFQKKTKEGNEKVSINDLLYKKKSADHIRKEKDPLWKQMMTNKASDIKDKLIRF